ncbi:sugar ABC transporter substrate-binding protein [Streptomyces tendae]|uniref:sugar ABC transporter substrate-binding protein n=1 Tax=Streptomyces tendae TaxID=1932 RepID=UPI003684F2F7
MPTPARRRRTLPVPLLGIGLLLSGRGLYSADSGSADDGPLTLGFVNGGDSRFHTCLQRSVEIAAKNNFARLVTANSRQDAATELSNIEDMIAREVDAIILQTVDTDALKRDIEKAAEADIPVFPTSVSTDPDDILGAVVVDLEAVGRLDAQWVADGAGGRDVQVAVVAGAPGAASDLLTDGFTKALPVNAEVVAEQPGMFHADKAEEVAAGMARAHPGLDGEPAVRNTIALLRGRTAKKIDHTPIRLVTEDDADTAPLYCPADY